MNIFVTGTDTGIGKTVVSTILALKFGAKYWKPVQSGTVPQTDSQWVGERLGDARIHPEVYRVHAPLSPHEAARLEGVRVDPDRILAAIPEEPVVIEGAGGVLVPLNENCLYADLMKRLGQPVVVVARTALGTINHTLLTLNALRQRDVDVLGVILVGESNPANAAAISHYGNVRVLGHIPPLPSLDSAHLQTMTQAITLELPNRR